MVGRIGNADVLCAAIDPLRGIHAGVETALGEGTVRG